MMAPHKRWRFASSILFVLALVGLWAAHAAAYDTFADCKSCHPGFGGFGATLHDLHIANPIAAVCSDCHVVPGDVPKIGLNAAGTTGCVGCHGRAEDEVGQIFGGYGTGLRLHHTNKDEASCAGCHFDDPAPVGEDVLPPFYASLFLDPAADNLDNDGDLLVDLADPDFSTGNSPPIVDTGGPYVGFVGQPVMFDASGTTDPDGDEMIFLWDFGDGSLPPFDGLPTASHIYTAADVYTAKVAVTDGVNLPELVEVTVTITEPNLPPIADAGGPYSAEVGESVTLDASGSFDPDGDNLLYMWDFGDGASSMPSPDPMASHAYDTDGEFTAEVTVTDGVNGAVTATATVTITDTAPPPQGDAWTLIMPYSNIGPQTLEFAPFAGIMLVEITQANGAGSLGIGMEINSMIFWMDMTGSIFFGNINRTAGTMSGIAFGGAGGGGIWFAEAL